MHTQRQQETTAQGETVLSFQVTFISSVIHNALARFIFKYVLSGSGLWVSVESLLIYPDVNERIIRLQSSHETSSHKM